uniref:Uncharacterized protein n=1 Tax=Physcomitrium patens TaxID=3218 RepID=A0A2K1J3H0_PHYPA|nr:hypothetical protein PHYPA_021927 [Physcomitrium patens]
MCNSLYAIFTLYINDTLIISNSLHLYQIAKIQCYSYFFFFNLDLIYHTLSL